MPPKLLAPSNDDIEADGLDQVHQCCARLGIQEGLRDAVGARLGVQGNFSVQFLAPLTDGERIDTVENVRLVDADNNPREPTIFEKSQIRSLFRLADIVAARLVRSPVVQQPLQPPPLLQGAAAAPHSRKIMVSDVLDPMDEGLVELSFPASSTTSSRAIAASSLRTLRRKSSQRWSKGVCSARGSSLVGLPPAPTSRSRRLSAAGGRRC